MNIIGPSPLLSYARQHAVWVPIIPSAPSLEISGLGRWRVYGRQRFWTTPALIVRILDAEGEPAGRADEVIALQAIAKSLELARSVQLGHGGRHSSES